MWTFGPFGPNSALNPNYAYIRGNGDLGPYGPNGPDLLDYRRQYGKMAKIT